MKKIVSVFAVVALFAACKSNNAEPQKTNVVLLQDTSTLYNNSVLTDKNHDIRTGASAGSALGAPVTRSSNTTNTGNAGLDKNKATGPVATNTAPAKKNGWSHRAKGAVVGAGAGAITGAIVNKNNRGVGALIGGAVGAASGYIIGNEVDKKKSKP